MMMVYLLVVFLLFFFGGVGEGGTKTGNPSEKQLTTCKQTLACRTCDPSWARTHSNEMMSDLER